MKPFMLSNSRITSQRFTRSMNLRPCFPRFRHSAIRWVNQYKQAHRGQFLRNFWK